MCERPRILVNFTPIDDSINQTLLDRSRHNLTSSSGFGSDMTDSTLHNDTSIHFLNKSFLSNTDTSTDAIDLTADDNILNLTHVNGSTPLKSAQSTSGDIKEEEKEEEEDRSLNDSLEKIERIIGKEEQPLSERRLQLLHDIGMEIVINEKRNKIRRTISIE